MSNRKENEFRASVNSLRIVSCNGQFNGGSLTSANNAIQVNLL